MEQCLTKTGVSDDGRPGIDKLRVDALQIEWRRFHSQRSAPLGVISLFERNRPTERQIEHAGEHIDDNGVGIRDELDFDLINSWAAVDVVVVRNNERVAAWHEIAH